MDQALHNKIERRVIELAKASNLDPTKLRPATYQMLYAKAYREEGKLLEAAGHALSSSSRVIFGKRVSKAKSEANEKQCEACPHDKFHRSGTGKPMCKGCGCSGKFLEIKWQDPKQHCPLTVSGKRCDFAGGASPNDPNDPPIWDNRTADTEDGIEVPKQEGDRFAAIQE